MAETTEPTAEEMAEYVREHRCHNARRDVTLGDWDRGIRRIEADAILRSNARVMDPALPGELLTILGANAATCGWDTRRGDGPIGGPCVLAPMHAGPHSTYRCPNCWASAHTGTCPDEVVNALNAPALPGDRDVQIDLPDHGFAANRPTGPRTPNGHGLAVALRKRDTEVDWDAWIRTIEDQAAGLRVEAESVQHNHDIVDGQTWVYCGACGTLGAESVGGLDRAWAEAEAALPKGGKDWAWKQMLVWHPLADDPADAYEARHYRNRYEWDNKPDSYVGRGPTPAAALHALALALGSDK